MRVAIIGAGIGGLVTAVGLQRDGHEVVVYERRADASGAGAGLSLFGNGLDALAEIGLADRVRTVAGTPLTGLRSGLRRPNGRWLATLPPPAAAGVCSIHRAALHRILLDALEPGTVRTGAAARVRSDGEPVVRVEGRDDEADLVVAADGARSPARAVLGLDPGMRRAGYTAWRGVTEEPLRIDAAGETWGTGRRFGIVPLAGGLVYWFAVAGDRFGGRTPDGDGEGPREMLRGLFTGWHDPVLRCIEATAPRRILRHEIADLVRPPDSYRRGGVVLLGDAAHAMTPDLGQGAGQAIEDAVALTLLVRRTPSDPGAAAVRYDEIRRAAASSQARRSRMMGRIGQATGPVRPARDAVIRLLPDGLFARMSARGPRWRPPSEEGTRGRRPDRSS